MSQRFSHPMQGQNQMPMQGPQVPSYNQQIPVQGSFQQMNMQGSGIQTPMRGQTSLQSPGTQIPMQGPVQGIGVQMPMQGSRTSVPVQNMVPHRPQMSMQGPGNPMAVQHTGPQMHMQSMGPQMPMHGAQTSMPMQNAGQQMPMQSMGPHMSMQRPQTLVSMQNTGSQMQTVQSTGLQMPQTSMPMQNTGPQMSIQSAGPQMLMQGPQTSVPMRNTGPQMQNPGTQMPMQNTGPQMPSQGVGPQMSGQGPMPVQSTGPQMPGPQMSGQGPMPVQGTVPQMSGQGPMPVQGPGQQMAAQRGQMSMFQPGQANPQMRPPGMNMTAQRMPQQFVPSSQGQFGVRPPPYTPDMAKDFVTKQQILQREQRKLIEKQRKKMEEEFKQRQFQETQKRLKEFSAIGGRKMDVDSAISSIIGPTDQHHSHPQGPRVVGPSHGPHQVNHTAETPPKPEAPPTTQEDDFADFMSCPVVAANQMAPHSESANEKVDNSVTGVFEGTTASPSLKREEQKDLTSMMFECSDLSAPKQAKSFKTRTSVKDVQRNVKVATFQQSNRSRQWSGDTEQLTELFTLPEASINDPTHPDPSHVSQPRQAGGGGAGTAHSPGGTTVQGSRRSKASLPKWLTGEMPVPDVYTMVLEACTREGEIDTSMLYPILLRSQLSKEVLGHLWTLCNKQTPGKLLRQELFLLLAMVTVAQNKMDISSLDILLQCVEPPVPNLGQHASPQQTERAEGTASTPADAKPSHPQTGQNVSGAAMTTSEDDFADFKSATPASDQRQDQEEEFGDFKSTAPVSAANSPLAISGTKPIHKVSSDLIGEEDKYAALRVSVDDPTGGLEISPEAPGLSTGANFADFGAFKDSSSTSDALSFSSPTSSNQGSIFSSEDSSLSNQKSDDSSWGFSANQKGDDNHWAFSSANQKKDDTNWALQSPTLTKKNIPPQAEDDFGDFADFRNSSNVPFSSTTTNEMPDKMSTLKALVMDKKLYSDKPKDRSKTETAASTASGENPGVPEHSTPSEDDWDPFVKSGDPAVLSFSVEEKSDFWGDSSKSTIQQSVHKGGLWPAEKAGTGDTSGGEGWADFSSAPVVGTTEQGLSSKEEPRNETPKFTDAKIKFDPKKANSLFSQNLSATKSGYTASTGLSALDTEPPEFPDSPEYTEPSEHHDKFAAFHGTSGFDLDPQNGLSSLAAPYGGFDDHEEPQKTDQPSSNNATGSVAANQKQANNIQVGDMKTSQSASSFEFSGWRSQVKGVVEDSQSMKSLDLPVTGSQEGSPAGMDSQSVSSLDFGTSEGGKKVSASASDNRSVGSLDLKSEQQEAEPEKGEESFGEFSGATTLPEPVKSWAVGEAPINQADRYSELMGEPRDSDRHLYCWDKCLSACVEVLRQANDTFNSIDSMSVCREVVESGRGREYLEGVTEIFRVGSRIRLAMHGLTMSSDDLEEHQKELHNLWNNLISFMANSDIMPSSQSLTFKKALIRQKEENLSQRLCGVCLLDANIYSDSEAANQESGHKLSYGGRHYHAPCANFWVNCVDSMLPALKIPELL